jgi:hypothetical protein
MHLVKVVKTPKYNTSFICNFSCILIILVDLKIFWGPPDTLSQKSHIIMDFCKKLSCYEKNHCTQDFISFDTLKYTGPAFGLILLFRNQQSLFQFQSDSTPFLVIQFF